eukprot:7123879-Ditylum_brightwellii.AAC.1
MGDTQIQQNSNATPQQAKCVCIRGQIQHGDDKLSRLYQTNPSQAKQSQESESCTGSRDVCCKM